MLIVLDRLLVLQAKTPWQDGLLLGVLAWAQLLTGEEVLAMEAVTAAIAVVVLCAINWSAVVEPCAVRRERPCDGGRVVRRALGTVPRCPVPRSRQGPECPPLRRIRERPLQFLRPDRHHQAGPGIRAVGGELPFHRQRLRAERLHRGPTARFHRRHDLFREAPWGHLGRTCRSGRRWRCCRWARRCTSSATSPRSGCRATSSIICRCCKTCSRTASPGRCSSAWGSWSPSGWTS